jgi:hypothetical protein
VDPGRRDDEVDDAILADAAVEGRKDADAAAVDSINGRRKRAMVCGTACRREQARSEAEGIESCDESMVLYAAPTSGELTHL